MSSDFTPALTEPSDRSSPELWFVFRRSRLLAKLEDQRMALPSGDELDNFSLSLMRVQFLGTLDGSRCYAAEVSEDTETPDGWSFQGIRRLYDRMEDGIFGVAGRAVQIVDWDRTNQFCGRCGSPNRNHSKDRAKECTACGQITYPRISPAIIVLVRNDDQLLLARAHRHPPGFYSVLAGFVDPGETLEEAVAREIYEEVGVRVKNIHYFGSQPWPFPNSLMIAFVCDYDGGEIVLEEDEIDDAAWFQSDQLPPIPPKLSIARRLIDWFVTEQNG